MSGDEATLQAFGKQIEFTTSSGVVVRGRAPTLAQALELLDLTTQVGKKTGALAELVRAFITATGAGDIAVGPLDDAFIEEVVPRFLGWSGVTAPEAPTSPP